MTAVFRSCLPRFYSNTNQSLSNEHLSIKTNSIISIDHEQSDENSMEYSSMITNQNLIKSKTTTFPQLHSSSSNQQFISEQEQSKRSTNPKTKKRGPPYSRINDKSSPLLTRLVGTIFGDQGFNNNAIQSPISSSKKQRTKRSNVPLKKSHLPSKSAIKKQFEENEQTLRSLVTLLTQMESNVKLPTTTENENPNLSIEKEQARNNNRMDDTYVEKQTLIF